jgi:SAM-dependent methyltransferase
MIDIKDYSAQYANHYSTDFNFERVMIDARRQQILDTMRKYRHRNILEIGCGLEPLFLHCDEFESYTIVEPSIDFTKNATILAANNPAINIINDFFEKVYNRFIGKSKIDFIVVSSLLHEVEDPAQLLDTIYKVCQPETTVHINVPNVYSFHRLLAYEMGIITDLFQKSDTETKFQRNTRFDKQSLFRIVERGGFKILTYGTYFVKPFTHEQMEIIIKKKIVDKAVIIGLGKMSKYMPDLGSEIYVNLRRR